MRLLQVTTLSLALALVASAAIAPHPNRLWPGDNWPTIRTRVASLNSTEWSRLVTRMDGLYGSTTWDTVTINIFPLSPDQYALMYQILKGLWCDGSTCALTAGGSRFSCDTNICSVLGVAHTAEDYAAKAHTALINGMQGTGNTRCGGSYLSCTEARPMFNGAADFQGWMLSVSRIYDWLFDNALLTSSDKSFVVQNLHQSAEGMMYTMAISNSFTGNCASCGIVGYQVYSWNGGFGGGEYNVAATNWLAAYYIGIATYGDGLNPTDDSASWGGVGSNEEMAQWWAWWDTGACPGGNNSTLTCTRDGKGGKWLWATDLHGPLNDEGGGYYWYLPESILQTVALGASSGLRNASADLPAGTLDRIIEFFLHLTSAAPSGTCGGGTYDLAIHWGDSGGTCLTQDLARQTMAMAVGLATNATMLSYGRYYLDNIVPTMTSSQDTMIFDMAFGFTGQAGWTTSDYKTAESFDFASGSSIACGTASGICNDTWGIFMRSSPSTALPWTTNDTTVSLYAGHRRGLHSHDGEIGNLDLYRKGVGMVWHAFNSFGWENSTDAHTAMTFKSAAEANFCATGETGYNNTDPNGYPLALDLNNPSYSYVRANLGPGYKWTGNSQCTDKVTDYVREVAYIKPDYLVVFDKASFNVAVAARWYLQSTAQPSGDKTGVTVPYAAFGAGPAQTLVVTPLLPTAANQSAAALEQWRSGGSPLPSIVSTFTGGAMVSIGSSCSTAPCTNQYRTTFNSLAGSDSATQQWLFAMQMRDASAATTPIVSITSGTVTAVHIKDPVVNQVVWFNNGTPKATFTLPITLPYSKSTAMARHLITNLPANTSVLYLLGATMKICAAGDITGCPAGQTGTTSSQGTLSLVDGGAAGGTKLAGHAVCSGCVIR